MDERNLPHVAILTSVASNMIPATQEDHVVIRTVYNLDFQKQWVLTIPKGGLQLVQKYRRIRCGFAHAISFNVKRHANAIGQFSVCDTKQKHWE